MANAAAAAAHQNANTWRACHTHHHTNKRYMKVSKANGKNVGASKSKVNNNKKDAWVEPKI